MMEIKTTGIHHVALRCADFERSRRFYLETLGFEPMLEVEDLLIFAAGSTAIALRGPTKEMPHGDRFDPFRVGLDHLALSCEDEEEIDRVTRALEAAGVWNTGARVDDTLGKKYVAFRDPDGVQWELYMK